MRRRGRVLLTLSMLVAIGAPAQAQRRRGPGRDAPDEPPTRSLAPYFLLPGGDPSIDRFPLLSTSAEVAVSGVIADVRVKQVYKNAGTRTIEAVYVFPASTRAAVYGMKMTIGERTIVAQIQEREQARQDYEQAKREGKSASLLEQHRPNVFQMNVANILPGDTISVELSYTELLVPRDAIYEFVFPTVVGPRYVRGPDTSGEGNDGWTANPTLAAGQPPPYALDLALRLDAGMPLFDLGSPSHKVNISSDGANRALVKLDPADRAGGNRDFVFRYRLAGDRISSGLLLSRGTETGSFLLMVQPPKQIRPADLPPREYIFIVDVSGSMNGFPLDISKRLIANLVSGLRPVDSFNIILFESTSTALAERSVPATNHNLEVARCFIDSQNGGGGTELLPALKRALSLPRVAGASRTVILATDGYVDVEAEAMRVAQQNLGNANLFAFGIGTSVNRFLIEALARVGRGEPAVVMNQDEAPQRADEFRRYVESPVLTGISVNWGNLKTFEVEPQTIPDVFASRPVVVFGKWSGEPRGHIVVRGRTGGQAFEQTIDASTVKVGSDDRGLRNLWARSRIEALSDLEALHDQVSHVKEITELGLRHSLLTSYTSFVAIDSQRRNVEGDSTTVRQPLPMPEGVSNLAVGEGAMNQVMAARAPAEPQAAMDQSSLQNIKAERDMEYEMLSPEAGVDRRGPTLPRGELDSEIGVALNVTPNETGKPVSIPLSLGYGLSNGLSLGLHSREGFCLTGESRGCARVFNQLGLDALVAFLDHEGAGLALRTGFSFASLDPLWPRLAFGLATRLPLVTDLLWLRFEPGFEWGLHDTAGNGAVFVLPVQLQINAAEGIALYGTGGLQAAWSRASKRYVIPAGIGLLLAPTGWLDVSLELNLAAASGSELPAPARRIFYDSAASITPTIYDRTLLLKVRLRKPTVRHYGGGGGYYEPERPRVMCPEVEWK